MGFFEKLKQGLSKTASSISSVFTASELDDEFYDDLEERLILADLGMQTTEEAMEKLRALVRERHIKTVEEAPRMTYCFAPVRAAVFSIRSVYAARHRGEGARCVLTSHRRISCAPAFALRLCVWHIYSSVFPFCACTKRSIA